MVELQITAEVELEEQRFSFRLFPSSAPQITPHNDPQLLKNLYDLFLCQHRFLLVYLQIPAESDFF
jgi:hypothetical protein